MRTTPDDLIWHRVDSQLVQAATPPRNPRALEPHAARLEMAKQMLALRNLPDFERLRILGDRLDAARRCTEAHPTSSVLWAELALAHADRGDAEPARTAATRAFELDALTPHRDKHRQLDPYRKPLSDLIAPGPR
jgi:hypothetical protein